jgi:hypothetical protein
MSLATKQSSSQSRNRNLTRFGFALALFAVLYLGAVIGFIIIY